MPTSWSDFPSHAGVPKLIPNPLAVDNVSVKNVPLVGEGGGYIHFIETMQTYWKLLYPLLKSNKQQLTIQRQGLNNIKVNASTFTNYAKINAVLFIIHVICNPR